MIGQCCNFHGINSTVEKHDIFLNFSRLRHLVNNAAIHIYEHDYIRMETNCVVFENFTASIVDLMVLHATTFFAIEGMLPLFHPPNSCLPLTSSCQ